MAVLEIHSLVIILFHQSHKMPCRILSKSKTLCVPVTRVLAILWTLIVWSLNSFQNKLPFNKQDLTVSVNAICVRSHERPLAQTT